MDKSSEVIKYNYLIKDFFFTLLSAKIVIRWAETMDSQKLYFMLKYSVLQLIAIKSLGNFGQDWTRLFGQLD